MGALLEFLKAFFTFGEALSLLERHFLLLEKHFLLLERHFSLCSSGEARECYTGVYCHSGAQPLLLGECAYELDEVALKAPSWILRLMRLICLLGLPLFR